MMFYVYCEAPGGRALLTAAADFISAQFLAAKYSLARPGRMAIYPAATGAPREPLMSFENGRTVAPSPAPSAPGTRVAQVP